ncbi:MAG: hypothetical protein LBE33_06390 [Zoogloeaceae bacterium]|jgi:hypothetical protein|nr:hypothetical protein [Zoogloeaceae bacterium]
MNTYRPEFFRIEELVTPAIYSARGERAWELLQARALVTLDQLRKRFGPITVNNWHIGGAYKESGLRDYNTPTGAALSQHKFGGAFDCKSRNVTPEEMHSYILSHPSEFPYLTTLEDVAYTPSWLHFDGRNHDRNQIWVVKP